MKIDPSESNASITWVSSKYLNGVGRVSTLLFDRQWKTKPPCELHGGTAREGGAYNLMNKSVRGLQVDKKEAGAISVSSHDHTRNQVWLPAQILSI